jgi:hypothetical protein
MLLFVLFLIASKLKVVQCTWKGSNNPPGSCERMHQFINPSAFGIGTGSTLSKYNVADEKKYVGCIKESLPIYGVNIAVL